MPELPEVEIIRLGLQSKIIGLKIKKIQVLNSKTFQGDPKKVEGQKVLKVWRRAKILGIDVVPTKAGIQLNGTDFIARGPVGLHPQSMSSPDIHRDAGTHWGSPAPATPRSGITLLFHLKMTGQLIYVPNDKRSTNNDNRIVGGHPTEDMRDKMPNRSTRVIFQFNDGSNLYFNDQRKFGWIRLSPKFKVQSEKFIKDLGPEPLEKGFTGQVLKTNLLKHKNLPVKQALMDQKVVSGVGNIYANEACFDAKINPKLKISELTDSQFKSLHQGVLKALKDGIKHGGSSRAHFVDSEGKKGYFLDYAYVYGRQGMPCKICGSTIQKLSLGERGTYFCPSCQSSVK